MRVAAVGDISDQIRGVTYAKKDASDVPLDGYSPILRANNIGEHGLVLEDLVFVPDVKISPKQRVRANDIVVAASSGSISVVGKTAQAREGFGGGFGAFCKVLRPGPEVDPHYFGHYFRTPAYRHVVSTLAAGVNINNLRNEHLANLKIPLPPLAEQKRIAAILDAADDLRAPELTGPDDRVSHLPGADAQAPGHLPVAAPEHELESKNFTNDVHGQPSCRHPGPPFEAGRLAVPSVVHQVITIARNE